MRLWLTVSPSHKVVGIQLVPSERATPDDDEMPHRANSTAIRLFPPKRRESYGYYIYGLDYSVK